MRPVGAFLAALVTLTAATGSLAAQEAAPTVHWDATPTICDVPPLSREVMETSLPGQATPVPDRQVASVSELPTGAEAGSDIVDRVESLENEYAACYNSGNWTSLLALMHANTRPDVLNILIEEFTFDGIFVSVGTPIANYPDWQMIDGIRVSDVRILADGRIGAIVEWRTPNEEEGRYSEVNFHIYEDVDGDLLLAEEISGFDYSGPGTPAP